MLIYCGSLKSTGRAAWSRLKVQVFPMDANVLFTTNLKEVPVFALECAWMGT